VLSFDDNQIIFLFFYNLNKYHINVNNFTLLKYEAMELIQFSANIIISLVFWFQKMSKEKILNCQEKKKKERKKICK